jgi:phage terminase small subunit
MMAHPNNTARMREVRAMARAIRDDDKHLGPKMRALTPHARSFVIEILFGPEAKGAGVRAARAAGYVNGEAARVTACRLINDPRIADAIDEIGGRWLKPAALEAVRRIVDIASDTEIDAQVRLKANQYIAQLGGFTVETRHVVAVERSRETVVIATEEVLAKIAKLSAQVGIDPQRQIEAAKTINGTAVEVEHEQLVN